jgi:hypothetical protein
MGYSQQRTPTTEPPDLSLGESQETPTVDSNSDRAHALGVLGLTEPAGAPPTEPVRGQAQWALELEGRDGTIANPERVRLEDTLFVICTLPSAQLEEDDIALQSSAQGFDAGAAQLEGATLRIPLFPTAFGQASARLALTVATPELLVEGSFDWAGTVEMVEGDFLDWCDIADKEVSSHYEGLREAMIRLKDAYIQAHEAHVQTLDAIEESRRAAAGVLLKVGIAFAAGVTGGLAETVFSAMVAGKFLVKGLVDLTKEGFKQSASPFADQVARGLSGPLPVEPEGWASELEARVCGEASLVHAILADWGTRAKVDLTFRQDFDPRETIAALSIGPLSMGAAIATLCPDPQAAALHFELGFWSAWLSEYAFEMRLHGPPTGGRADAYVEETVPTVVAERIGALGQDPEAFVAQHGAPARERAEQQKAEHDRTNPRFPWQ